MYDSLPLLYKTGIQEAAEGSFQHWKALMEMAGEYEPAEGKGAGPITINLGGEKWGPEPDEPTT